MRRARPIWAGALLVVLAVGSVYYSSEATAVTGVASAGPCGECADSSACTSPCGWWPPRCDCHYFVPNCTPTGSGNEYGDGCHTTAVEGTCEADSHEECEIVVPESENPISIDTIEAAVAANDWDLVGVALANNPTLIVLIEERQAIQFLSCGGAVVRQLILDREVFRSLASP